MINQKRVTAELPGSLRLGKLRQSELSQGFDDTVAEYFFREIDVHSGKIDVDRLAQRGTARGLREQAAAFRSKMMELQPMTADQANINTLARYASAFDQAADIAMARELKHEQLFTQAETALADTNMSETKKIAAVTVLASELHAYKTTLGEAIGLIQLDNQRLQNLIVSIRRCISSRHENEKLELLSKLKWLLDTVLARGVIKKIGVNNKSNLAIDQTDTDADNDSDGIVISSDEDESDNAPL